MGVPQPDLSVRLGTPNACTGCHEGRTDSWAAEKAKADAEAQIAEWMKTAREKQKEKETGKDDQIYFFAN